MKSRMLPRLVLPLSSLALCAACASTEPPVEAVARAETAFVTAEKAGAATDSPLYMRKSRENLDRAKEAIREERYDVARRSAEAAQVEAQHAAAESRKAQADRSLKELNASVSAVKEEIEDDREKP